ncbi:MAG: BCD family MFS transporter [Anaerolineales bacterium]|nr:BCD family MFS transporter [Anaerolineales bacterium]
MKEHTVNFSGWRLARLSSFRIGSAMVEILATSIWNRVMISTLGVPATAVGLLLGLRYFLAPFSVWVGHRSDTIPLWGYYRTSYIWLGRFLTVLCLPFLALSLMRLETNSSDPLGWALAVGCTLLYAVGSVLTGSPYLALVRDSAPAKRQGFSISITETSFIIFIAIAGIGFARWMENYTINTFWQMVIACMAVGAFFWIFGIYGVEKNSVPPHVRADLVAKSERNTDVWGTFRKIWADPRTRLFFLFLSVSTLAAWSQDTILEPFGAEVLRLPVDDTTRFTSYWQGATVLTLVGGAFAWRKRPPEKQSGIARWGLIFMGIGMALIALESILVDANLIIWALLIFGGGFGIYTFGSLSLMAVMASDEDAGAYLGLWTISILVFKGLGTFLGGAFRDIFLLLMGLDGSLAYGITFALAAVGLFIAVVVLSGLDVEGFAAETGRVLDAADVQAAGIEL